MHCLEPGAGLHWTLVEESRKEHCNIVQNIARDFDMVVDAAAESGIVWHVERRGEYYVGGVRFKIETKYGSYHYLDGSHPA